MKTPLLAIAAGVTLLAATTSFSPSALADRICKKECSEGVCRTHCFERDRDRDHVVVEHRDRHRDHDHDHDHDVGIGVEVGH